MDLICDSKYSIALDSIDLECRNPLSAVQYRLGLPELILTGHINNH